MFAVKQLIVRDTTVPLCSATLIGEFVVTTKVGRLTLTPEMMEAGADVLRSFHTFYEGEEVWVKRIFEVIWAAHERDAQQPAEAAGR